MQRYFFLLNKTIDQENTSGIVTITRLNNEVHWFNSVPNYDFISSRISHPNLSYTNLKGTQAYNFLNHHITCQHFWMRS